MKITKYWKGEFDGNKFQIALFNNGDCIVCDDAAVTILKPDLSTLATWYKETPDGPHWAKLQQVKLEPISPKRELLLQAWDTGHRFEADQRRTEAIQLLYNSISER